MSDQLTVLFGAISILGFFAVLAGFIAFLAAIVNDLVYRWERRRDARHPRPEPFSLFGIADQPHPRERAYERARRTSLTKEARTVAPGGPRDHDGKDPS